MLRYLLGAILLAGIALQSAFALPTVSVKGAKFFANGQQFFLKGVAYQGTPSDPLVDTNQCQLDASSMQAIGTNSIRVYHVDPNANHDGCMSAFANAGIYVWLDLDTFNTTIVQTAPTWTEEQFRDFARVMDVFQGYTNLAGFWIGNEVINNAGGSFSAPYIKAAVADMKSYMAAKSYRTIPIGYSAADIAELRPMLQNYLACGSQPDQAIDFFGLNSYEWCGEATYDNSGYSNLQAMSEGYSIPIFFSETGCNVRGARTFADQKAIFGPNMTDTWSGSIIYEWVEEANHYGLVTYPNGEIYSGAPIPLSPDYQNLANVWKGINPTGVAEGSYTPSNAAPACPLATDGWAVNGDVPLPILGAKTISAVAANQVQLPSSSAAHSSAAFITLVASTSDYSPSIIAIVSASSSASASPSASSPTSESSSSTFSISSHSSSGSSTDSTTRTSSTGSTVPLVAASQTSASPSASTSHSSASSNLGSNFWAFANMFGESGWFLKMILPIIGVAAVVSFL